MKLINITNIYAENLQREVTINAPLILSMNEDTKYGIKCTYIEMVNGKTFYSIENIARIERLIYKALSM